MSSSDEDESLEMSIIIFSENKNYRMSFAVVVTGALRVRWQQEHSIKYTY